MHNTATLPAHQRLLRTVQVLLTLILLVKLAGFFTWSEDVGVTRILKTGSRLAMTLAAAGVSQWLQRRGAVAAWRWQHSLAVLLYGAYLLLGLASLLWSGDPGYSLLQLLMVVETLVFAYFYAQCFVLLDRFYAGSGIHFARVLGTACLWLVLVFLVGAVVAPDTFYRLTSGGEEARLGGFLINPNELGMLCVVGGAGLACNFHQGYRPRRTLLLLLPLVAALLLTGSRSSLAGAGLVLVLHLRQVSRRGQLLALAGAGASLPLLAGLVLRQGGLEEVLSLTGRLPFWQALLTEGLPREPLLGYGFMRIAYGEFFQSTHTYAAQMTHNTFIQVLLNLGVVGFALVLAQLLLLVRGGLQQPGPAARLLFVGLLIPLVINSLTEFGIFGQSNFGILFYQLLIFLTCLRFNEHLTTAEILLLRRRRPDLLPAGLPPAAAFRPQ
jgi:exopolysaccharide production protein ExoQ